MRRNDMLPQNQDMIRDQSSPKRYRKRYANAGSNQDIHRLGLCL